MKSASELLKEQTALSERESEQIAGRLLSQVTFDGVLEEYAASYSEVIRLTLYGAYVAKNDLRRDSILAMECKLGPIKTLAVLFGEENDVLNWLRDADMETAASTLLSVTNEAFD